MYSAATAEPDQRCVMDRYKTPDRNLRVLISTTAFGMGIDIPDIDIVVHWGLPRTTLQYFQQAGRAGRDGRKATSLLYVFPTSVNSCKDKSMTEIADVDFKECLRLKILKSFCVNLAAETQLENLKAEIHKCTAPCGEEPCKCSSCKCCQICTKLCLCSKDKDKIEKYLLY